MCISPGIIEFSTTTSQVSRGKLGEGASEIIPVGICKQGCFCITQALKKMLKIMGFGIVTDQVLPNIRVLEVPWTHPQLAFSTDIF